MNRLDIESHLVASCDDIDLIFTATGKNAVLTCSRLSGGKTILKLLSMCSKSKEGIRRLTKFAIEQNFSLDFVLSGRTVMRAGRDARPGPVSFLFGVSPLEIRSLQLYSAFVESKK